MKTYLFLASCELRKVAIKPCKCIKIFRDWIIQFICVHNCKFVKASMYLALINVWIKITITKHTTNYCLYIALRNKHGGHSFLQLIRESIILIAGRINKLWLDTRSSIKGVVRLSGPNEFLSYRNGEGNSIKRYVTVDSSLYLKNISWADDDEDYMCIWFYIRDLIIVQFQI